MEKQHSFIYAGRGNGHLQLCQVIDGLKEFRSRYDNDTFVPGGISGNRVHLKLIEDDERVLKN